MSFEIRPRRAEDLPHLADLLGLVQEHDHYPAKLPEDPVAWLSDDRIIEASVAEEGGELLGHICLARAGGDYAEGTWRAALSDRNEELAVIKRLFVHPGHRSLGLGRSLLESAVARAHARRERPVLDVDARSQGARRLYLRAGFVEVAEIEVVWRSGGPPFLAACYLGPPPANPEARRPT